jgi:NhaP-type Na+/H+ or K+/H+ antiporter
VRHSLNLESGLNDGLALPAVLAFTAALVGAGPDGKPFVWWHFVLQDVVVGLVTGIVVAFVAARLTPPDRQRSLYALGTAFAAYGLAVALPPAGNGLISTFVCAIALGIMRPDLRAAFEHGGEDFVEIVKLGVFVVFGSLLTLGGLFNDGWAAIAIVAITLLVARPVAIFAALVGTRTPRLLTAFMAWFGPKGVATMTFSLLVLSSSFAAAGRIFDLAALAVVVSVLAHGLTDTPAAEWVARREAATRGGQPAPAR